MRPSLAPLFAASMLCFACRPSAPPPSSYTIDTLPNGATRVVNTAPAGWRDSSGITLVLEHVIAPGDGAPGELANPRELAVLAGGRVAVNDGTGEGIFLFAPDGNFVRQVGRHGDGPGEYGEMFSMAATGDYIVTQECNKGRATAFNVVRDSAMQWQSVDCMGGEDVRLSPEGMIWLGDRLRDTVSGSAVPILVHWNTRGERLDTFRLPPWHQPAIWTDGNAAVPIPFSPHSHDAGAPPLIWSGYGDALVFALVNASGDTVRVATIPGRAVAIADSVRQAVIDRFARSPRFAKLAKLEDVPLTQPLFTAMSVDELGRLWIHRPRPDGTVGSFEVLGRDGIWLGTVRAPDGVGGGFQWAEGRFYRIIESSSGTPAIEVYRVADLPP